MLLPSGATVAVTDGQKLILFHNIGHDGHAQLAAAPSPAVDADHPGADTGHTSSAANPDQAQVDEDGFAVGVADLLNRQVLSGGITDLVIIAPPRTLGALRKHYHQKLSAVLAGEIGKELTGHTVQEIEKAIQAA
jgi:protein required for attachment to host cells